MAKSAKEIPLIDPGEDITRASTLPGSFYTDEEIFARMKEEIFVPSWQMIATTDQLKVPGDYEPITLLPAFLNEPLLLTRDEQDIVHCLSNVCTHRAHLVAQCAGHGKSLRCRYHGRKFNLDGSFVSMPEFDQACNFPSASDNLPELSLASLGKFLFTSLAPGRPFPFFSDMVLQRTQFLPFDELRLDETRSRDYLVECNWALYCENYLEGFHIPFVHKSLNDGLNYGQYSTQLYPGGVLQIGVSDASGVVFDLPSDHPDTGRQIAAFYYFLFPNTMLNIYPWGISVNIVKPLSIRRTRVSFLTYVWDESLLDQGVGAELDRVEREDETVVENVQLGVASRLYQKGRFSPTREQGVFHFQRMLFQTLAGTTVEKA